MQQTLRCASVLGFRAVCSCRPSDSNCRLLRGLWFTSRPKSKTQGSDQPTNRNGSEAAQNCRLIIRKNAQKNHDELRLVESRIWVLQYQIGKSCLCIFDR